ncbi:Fatty acid/phospholipid biosynthesis enzyme [Cetobacterium ceti]|uniref:Fatty acid/phospholipid biosynthesis enzyme n=1 Tax=Cetobacterium ceti TaxID=180163 RepID=A0A1T4LL86_9FUSO|nr:glycine/sarcosine/betaine reductase complex component C subunit alpha [Cetobacterium ceti]SJZ55421.1 Fatty acid/phospholipid biosynthesis enzyme [Cetobacterium ceti]
MSENLNKIIGNTFLELADALEKGHFGSKIKVGITTLGSEHGVEAIIRAAEAANQNGDFQVVLIGKNPTNSSLEFFPAEDEKEAHKIMEDLLEKEYISGAVTMHYSFPIGVSTVGKILTPGLGKSMFIATTTGTSATDRSEAMFKNSIYGIIAAKSCGIENPTLGILNIDNAREVERALKKLSENGYPINFGESQRADGGNIMRGNDLLMGTTDIMVVDSLTGNILMKVFSAFNTGGSYEALGYGYGPGIGFDYDKEILIISRASGEPVVTNALIYAAQLAKNNFKKVLKDEFAKVKKAKFDEILNELKKKNEKSSGPKEEFVKPNKEVVTEQISGIDIMDLEDAVEALMKKGIYAESGMGCTGPIILVNEKNVEKATEILVAASFK